MAWGQRGDPRVSGNGQKLTQVPGKIYAHLDIANRRQKKICLLGMGEKDTYLYLFLCKDTLEGFT